MTELIKYTRQSTIHLKDGETIDIPEEKINAVMLAWQNKGIINLGNQAFDSIMISRIEEGFAKPDLSSLTSGQKAQLKARSKLFKDNLARDPAESVIYGWVEKLKKGLTI